GDKPVTGDISAFVIEPCRTVGRPIFFSVLIMLLSFVPVFMLSGREGKYFHPLAFTKSFAMIGVALISVTVVPALIPTFLKGKLKSEEDNAIVRSFIYIYKPLLTWALPRRNLVMWMFAVLLILGAGIFPLQALIGQGASEDAWRTTFLGVFALVTSLTVALTNGKRGQDVLYLLLAVALLGLAAGCYTEWGRLGEIIASVSSFAGNAWRWLCLTGLVISLMILFAAAIGTQHVILRQGVTLASLVLIGLWAYRFQKIGVTFMPALDEGTTLDMPITVPRASVTEAADDLKARDALLRGFPEVESVIGKAGRADTPTDPAPLDMVETFVNFRPKELWPKRVLAFDDAFAQTNIVWNSLEERGFLQPGPDPKALRAAKGVVAEKDRAAAKKVVEADEARRNAMNDAAQKALERFDEMMRDLAQRRYAEFERELESTLTHFAVTETFGHLQQSGELHWPDAESEGAASERLSARLTPEYGRWLARNPALEDVANLARRVAADLAEQGFIADVAGALQLKTSRSAAVVRQFAEALGGERQTVASVLLHEIEERRLALWRDRVRTINWELFDQGTDAFNTYALEEVAAAAGSAHLIAESAEGARLEEYSTAMIKARRVGDVPESGFESFVPLREERLPPFRKSVFFWPRKTGPKGDLVDDEMGRVLQVPGWSNIFTQPIINRIEMLSTGVRTDIGVKVFGPDLELIDKVCKDVEAAIKPINGARDVIAAPIMGKG
ncbi:MAG: efflux RND transporter permease subunit, partial [Planctomycetia bacterium]|nr:efflux RND transporter permease subunit [Planctomycetia bacterium]